MIYFARSTISGLVKIGYTAGDPSKRLADLETGAGPLDLLGTLEGDRSFETGLHARFAADRVHGEWFRLSPDVVTDLLENARARAATGFVFKRGRTYHVRYTVGGKRVQESANTADRRQAQRLLAQRIQALTVEVAGEGAPLRPPPKSEAESLAQVRADLRLVQRDLDSFFAYRGAAARSANARRYVERADRRVSDLLRTLDGDEPVASAGVLLERAVRILAAAGHLEESEAVAAAIRELPER